MTGYGNLILDLSTGIEFSLLGSYIDENRRIKFQPLDISGSNDMWIAQQPDNTTLLNVILVEMTNTGIKDVQGSLKTGVDYYLGANQIGLLQLDDDGFYFNGEIDEKRLVYINIPTNHKLSFNDNNLTKYMWSNGKNISNFIEDGPARFSLAPIVNVEGNNYINLNDQLNIGGQDQVLPTEQIKPTSVCGGACAGSCYGSCPAGKVCGKDVQGFYRCVSNGWYNNASLVILIICVLIIVVLLLALFHLIHCF